MSDVVSLPAERCEECHELRPAIGFVALGQGYKNLCSCCYNRRYMQRLGLPELETVDFEPLTLRDAWGVEHTFHFVVQMSTGLEISAFEWVDGAPGGYRFAVLDHPEVPVRQVHAALVSKIERGLAERYLVPGSPTDPDGAHLHIAGDALNARIEERNGEPRVVVDGHEYTWEELGRSLISHAGFTLRLECFDPHEDPPVTSHPVRPHLWWLDPLEEETAQIEDDFRPH